MALLGQGVLAIWNGVTAGFEDEFTRWHVQEHIPERVGIAGFERGRRYVAVDGQPPFFNFYETQTLADLESPAYKERLNNPTPWTLACVKQFTDTSRTLCDVVLTRGRGEGVFIETIALETAKGDDVFTATFESALDHLSGVDGVVGLHLLRGRTAQDKSQTEEQKLRGLPDQEIAWLLLIEAIDPEPLIVIRDHALTDTFLTQIGSTQIRRGIYRLQYGLSKDELSRG